jgi:hypothetical protein
MHDQVKEEAGRNHDSGADDIREKVKSYTLHLTPYTLHPTPYTIHLTPYTLNLNT